MSLSVAPVAPIGSHPMLIFLLQIGALLGLAFLLGRLAIRIGMPALIGELCAGVVLGPSLLEQVMPAFSGWLFPRDPAQLHLLDAVGQIGVLLLVGITGAQMDLKLVRRRGLTALRVSVAGLVLSLALGVGAGLLMPGSLVPGTADRGTFALFVGVAVGVSAVPVIAKILMELRLLHRNIGQLTLCAVMVDDILGWLLLSVVSAMATTGVRAGEIALSVGYIVLTLAAAPLVRPAMRAALAWADRTRDATPTVVLVVVFIMLSAAATQAMKLEAVMGAFICGIVISSCGTVSPARMAPLTTTVMAFLAPLFFATAGLRMDLGALADPVVLAAGVGLLAVAITGKFAGAYAGARVSRLNRWESLALGAGMNTRGVPAVIIAMVGLRIGALSAEMYTVIVLVTIITALMAPPLLRVTMARVEHTAEERLREGRGLHEDSGDATTTASARG